MKRIDSLISLINTLSKPEKKAFSMQVLKDKSDSDYAVIYSIICKEKQIKENEVKQRFLKLRSSGSFEVAVKYLYDKLLDCIQTFWKEKDSISLMLDKFSKARMLYDRSLYAECFELMEDCIEMAKTYESNELLVLSIKQELEYFLGLNFTEMTEQEIYSQHHLQNEALKKIRKNIEQSSLHNLLKYRLSYGGEIRSEKQKSILNDLMVNEFYIARSNDEDDDFELTRNHKLFQANYLLGTGDYKAALNSFQDLNTLFEENPQFWAKPPVYYLSVLEGIIKSLRTMGNYDEIPHYLDKLRDLTHDNALIFNVNVNALILQYELFPCLDIGDFASCLTIINKYQELVLNKESYLNPIRKSELLIYRSIVYIGLGEFKEARKLIGNTMFDHNVKYLPSMRTVRILRLIVYFDLKEFDLLGYDLASVKRQFGSKKNQGFQTEKLIFWLLERHELPILKKEREGLWNKIYPKIIQIHKDKYENQLIGLFDFTAWIEARLLKKSLSSVLYKNKFTNWDTL